MKTSSEKRVTGKTAQLTTHRGSLSRYAIAATVFLSTLAFKTATARADIGWAISGDHLYTIADGGTPTELTSGWSGATSMANPTNDSGALYIVQNSRLWRVADALSGTGRVQLGDAVWGGATEMTYNISTTKLYIVQNNHLQRIDNTTTGGYTVLGGAIWDGTTSMTSVDSSLYIIRNSFLYKVNPSTGARVALGSADWPGATRMVAQTVSGSNKTLFIVENNRLHRADPTTGSWVLAGTADWTGTTSMFCHDPFHSFTEMVSIFENSRLHDVQWNGDYTVLGLPEWAGSIVSTGNHCNL